jgi:uncharacterized phage protein (TIGR02216 family)
MSLLPWDEMLRAGLRMGLAPDRVWRLSLKEWRALTGQGAHGRGMERAHFQRLLEAFPDVPDTSRSTGASPSERPAPYPGNTRNPRARVGPSDR